MRGQHVCIVFIHLFVTSALFGQAAVNLKGGLLYKQFEGEPKGHLHYGQSIGLDVLVEDTRLLFMPGLHYQQFAIGHAAAREGLYHRLPHYHQLNVPVSFGTWFAGGRHMRMRIYGGGHLSFIVGVDDATGGPGIDQLTLVHPGWQGGAQVMLWRVTAEARYVRDYRQIITANPGTTMRGWEIYLGFAL